MTKLSTLIIVAVATVINLFGGVQAKLTQGSCPEPALQPDFKAKDY